MKSLGIRFSAVGNAISVRNCSQGILRTELKWSNVVRNDSLRHASRSYSLVAKGHLAVWNVKSTHPTLSRVQHLSPWCFQTQQRWFSSQNDGSDDASPPGPVTPPILGSGEENDGTGPVIHSLPATMTVPENWPSVPVIAINRNPVFPRFIKIIEVKCTPAVLTFTPAYFFLIISRYLINL